MRDCHRYDCFVVRTAEERLHEPMSPAAYTVAIAACDRAGLWEQVTHSAISCYKVAFRIAMVYGVSTRVAPYLSGCHVDE